MKSRSETTLEMARIVPISRRSLWWRLFFVAALLGHAPATLAICAQIISGGNDESLWIRLLVLSGCNVFFLLEIVLAPSLRLVSDRRTALILLLIVAVLHAGPIERGLPDVIVVRDAEFWLALTAFGVLGRSVFRRLPARANVLVDRLSAGGVDPPRPTRLERASDGIGRRPRPAAAWYSSPLRAPPPAAF
ncbi:MAG: hypothetical protein V3T70_10820 [Phycisphaerae bacterium]